MRLWEWAKAYPIKASMAAASVLFVALLIFVHDNAAVETGDVSLNFLMRVSVLVLVGGVIVAFTRQAWESLIDGRISSPMGLVLGIWCSAVGIALHVIFEELPEAVLSKLDAELSIYEHDHPLHWLHHLSEDLAFTEMNLVATFFVIMGSFLVLLASQRLSKRMVVCIIIWIVVAAVAAQLSFHYGVVPYLTNL